LIYFTGIVDVIYFLIWWTL